MAATMDAPTSAAPFKIKLRVNTVAQRENEEKQKPRPMRQTRRNVDYRQIESFGSELQPGTDFAVLLESKRARLIDPPADVVRIIPGELVTAAWLEADGFTLPLIVHDSNRIPGLRMPGSEFTIDTVVADVGGKRELDVIEVATQSELLPKWTLAEFAEYYKKPAADRARILNVISLEVSNTPLRSRILSPAAVRAIDWIDTVWPREAENGNAPAVQHYCLMSVAGSYTDFHIDFGGSSVWYHIVRGEKVFLLVRPTTANLAKFEHWCNSERQALVFFGDQVDACYRLRITQGQTLFIPSGWIHAVFTPIDSMVFGGNFVHSLSVEMQLSIAALEARTFVPPKFRFPYFDRIHWYAAKKMAERFEAVARDQMPRRPMLPLERKGYTLLAEQLHIWADSASDLPASIQEPLRLANMLRDYTNANADVSVSLNAPALLPLAPPPPLKLRLSVANIRPEIESVPTSMPTAAAAASTAAAAMASLAALSAMMPAIALPLPATLSTQAAAVHASSGSSSSLAPEEKPGIAHAAPSPTPELPASRMVLKLKKSMKEADSPQAITLASPVVPETRKKRRTWQDEDEYEYGGGAGDGDDEDWGGEPEVDAEEDEDEDEEEPYAPAGDADADEGDADVSVTAKTKVKAKFKAKPKAKVASSAPRNSPAVAKKIMKQKTSSSTARQRLQQKIGFHGTPARAFPTKR